MKILENFAIWFLRKRKKSVIIRFKIKNAEINCQSDVNYFYDNNFENCVFKDKFDNVFDIPKGKFEFDSNK